MASATLEDRPRLSPLLASEPEPSAIIGPTSLHRTLAAHASYFAASFAAFLIACFLAMGVLACTDTEPLALQLTRVVPEADPQCGAPPDGRTLVVTALGDFPAGDVTTVSRRIDASGPLVIDGFPAATRVIRVEVLGDAGAIRAMGKSAPFSLDNLPDGATVPVFTAPPRGLCGTGPPIHGRIQPLLARVQTRAGERVIVAGGLSGAGLGPLSPVLPIEHYDPSTGRAMIDQGEHYGVGEHGLIGATLTALLPGDGDSPDGQAPAGSELSASVGTQTGNRVLLAGGGVPAFQIYDGPSDTWSSPLFLSPGRGHHAAVALDEHRVLLAGGCAPFDEDHECEPATADLSTTIVDVDTGTVSPGPRLSRPRIGATAIRESQKSVLIIGGTDESGSPIDDIERVFLDGRTGELIPSVGAGSAVALASGSALFGFAPRTVPGIARLGLVPASGRDASTLVAPPWPLSEVTMTGLHDGRVLVVGQRDAGSSTPMLALYEPNRSGFVALDTADGRAPGAGHGAIALADGTVLLVGGRPPGEPSGEPLARAWILRPDLTGPYTSDLFVSFADAALAQYLIPRDATQHTLMPGTDEVPAHALITAGNDGDALPAEWAILAGPVFTRGQVTARVRALSGGVALLFGYRAPDRYLAAVLNPGQPVTVYQVVDASPRAISGCDAQVVSPAQLTPAAPGSAVEIALSFTDDAITAAIDDTQLLRCQGPLPDDPPGPLVGRVGLGVTGATGAQLRVDLLTATR